MLSLVGLVGPAGGRATAGAAHATGPSPPPSASDRPPPSPPSAALYRAIPNRNEQRAQREVVQEIQKAQQELGTSASGIGATAPPRSITWIQSGAVRLVDQAARLQISDTIAPTSGAVVPEIATLSGLREQAERLRTAIQDQADRVRDDADPTRDAATVSAFVDVLEPNVAKLRDVTRQADQQIDKRRATYLSSASLLQSTALTNTKSWLRCLRRSSPEPSSQPPRPPSAALACVRGAKCASTPAFHDAEAADGWEDLCKQARGAPRTAWEALTRAPRDRSNPARQAQLRLDLATRTVGGRQFEQWQYEITAGGRTWYCPNPDKMIVLVMYAGVGHPRATDT